MHQREDEGVTKRDVFMWECGNSHYDTVSNVKYIFFFFFFLNKMQIAYQRNMRYYISSSLNPHVVSTSSRQVPQHPATLRIQWEQLQGCHSSSLSNSTELLTERDFCCVGQISCGADSWLPHLTVPLLAPQTQANNAAAATCGRCCDASHLNGIWLQKCSRSSWNDFFLPRFSLNWHC